MTGRSPARPCSCREGQERWAISPSSWRAAPGATVVTTVSSDETAELARAAGAHAVVNYRDADTLTAIRKAVPGGVDRVVEVAPSNLSLDSQLLAPRGVVMMYASTGEDPSLPVRALMNLNASVRCMLVYSVPAVALDAAVENVSCALGRGR